ncbi:MAG TPA: hypothetical protein VGG46_02455 [Terriglobales bacterium]|jgi:hypothetical protein
MRRQRKILWLAFCAVSFIISATATSRAALHPNAAHPNPSEKTWHFAVSGDSRNCGDVVMPAIAAGVKHDEAAFYWHLGDLRWIVDMDQDFRQLSEMQGKRLSVMDYPSYLRTAWDDFVQSQIKAFGDMPFYVGIGNHELYFPKTRSDFVTQFTPWLDTPELRAQRLKDDPNDHAVKTYYHWVRDGIDFINLDNASKEEFDATQLEWLESILKRDEADPAIHTIVVGMHEALPESISADHSMNMWPRGVQTGLQVYHDLLKAQNDAKKKVYVLASHSHYFMDGTYQTEYWKKHGGVLPGWIIGTAGAERYPLPPGVENANAAKQYIYGYLLATVNPPHEPVGTIRFEFKQLDENTIPAETVTRFSAPFVHQCFTGNRRQTQVH